MSNDVYVYNIAAPVVVAGGRVQGTRERVEGLCVVEAPNRVPIPWLVAFLPTHLRPVNVTYQTGPNEWSTRRALLPVASVNDALHAFLARRTVITALVNDDQVAEGYFQLMLEGLSALPLPYLALDPFEVVDLNDAEEPSRAVARALGTDASSAIARLELSLFTPGVRPYSSAAIYTTSPDELTDAARSDNAVALDPGFLPSSQWTRQTFALPPQQGLIPVAVRNSWWRLW